MLKTIISMLFILATYSQSYAENINSVQSSGATVITGDNNSNISSETYNSSVSGDSYHTDNNNSDIVTNKQTVNSFYDNINTLNNDVNNVNGSLNAIIQKNNTVYISLHISTYLNLAISIYLLACNRRLTKKIKNISESS